MRIASGTVDQPIYFVAVDSIDLTTRETGLSGFTVYRSRNGGAAAAYTTPTVSEVDAANMPGVYKLLLDEDMTIDAGDETQEVCLHITQASMAPVTRTFELYRPKITVGNALDVTAAGNAGIDWGNIESPTATVGLLNTTISGLAAPVTVGAVSNGAITNLSLAAGTIDANAVAASAVTEIQTGLATSAAQATGQATLADILADTAVIGSTGQGLTSLASAANLDTVESNVVDAIAGVDNKIGTPDVDLATDISAIEGGGGGTTQPRANKPPAPAFILEISSRADGTTKAIGRIPLTAGAVGVAVGVKMDRLYGKFNVLNVGTPVISGGSITADPLGPYDTIAMVWLDGTATAGEVREVIMPVTMDTGGDGELVNVAFDIGVLP